MTADDFRRIALSFEGTAEGSHVGALDFRVGGRIFATLASVKQGYGNLMLSPEQQAAFVAEQPELYLPVPGGWGRNGATHIRLSAATEDTLTGALRAAWLLRLEKNRASSRGPAIRSVEKPPKNPLKKKPAEKKKPLKRRYLS